MAKVRQPSSKVSSKKIRPALSPEAREQQLIALAVDLVEQRMLDGTASSQETTHFLKLGSSKAQAELEKLRAENELLKAKTEQVKSMQRNEELMEEAIRALRGYQGQGVSSEEDPDV